MSVFLTAVVGEFYNGTEIGGKLSLLRTEFEMRARTTGMVFGLSFSFSIFFFFIILYIFHLSE